MFTLFETVLNMSLTASVVVLAVLLTRVFMKKASRKFCYLLWLVVAFRLVIPFSFESAISIFNLGGEMPAVEIPQTGTVDTLPEDEPAPELSAPETSASQTKPPVGGVNKPAETPSSPDVSAEMSVPGEDVSEEEQPEVSVPGTEGPQLPDWVAPGITNPGNPEVSRPVQDAPGEDTSLPGTTVPETEVSVEAPVTPPAAVVIPEPEPVSAAGIAVTAVWLAGIAVMLGYSLISYIKLRKRLSTAVLLEGNVYGSDRIDAPFALGVFKPRIYIPFGLSDSAREYILAHERYHLKRLDHMVKPISFGILALHWFNPLCWIAFNRMSLDMELSCDEAVLARYGNETMKKQYTKTLLDFATNKRFPSPAPLSFSEGASAKTRIKNALYWKKPKVWLSAVAMVLSLVILVACAGNAISGVSGELSGETPEQGILTFGETPYEFTFVSNGDGTCTITEVLTDYFHEGKYDLVIPATSPDGDKVVEVDLNGMNALEELIVPPYLLPKTLETLVDTIANSGVDGAARASKTFKAFYMDSIRYCKDTDHPTTIYDELAYPDGLLPNESAQFVRREPYIASEEVQRLVNILKECTDYTEEQCYADVLAVVEMLEKLEWESDEALEQFKRDAVSFFYSNTRRISKVVLPSPDVKVHQGFLGLSYVLTDGTAHTPVYENPFTLEKFTAEETENVLNLDEEGNEVIAFTSTRPVKDFHILTIDMADPVTTEKHPGSSLTTFHKAFTETYKLLLGENIPTRGISFVGEDGKTHEYAICYVGSDGSYELVPLAELSEEAPEALTFLVKRVADSTASKKTVYLSHPMAADYDYFSITANQPMTNVQIYFFQADEEHTTKGWWYEGGAASDVAVDPSAPVVEFLPVAEGQAIYVGAHSTTVTDTWGISFTDYQGNKRYFAVFPALDGKRQIIEMELDQTRMQFLPNTCPELDYTMLDVVQTFSDSILVLHDPRAEEDEQYVLIWKKSDGTYVEIFRAKEGFYKNLCYAGSNIAFNNFEPECTTEAFVYNTSTGKLTKLDQSILPEEETISYMGWLDSDHLLFVSQLDHGTIVKGGELWYYNARKDTYQKVFDVSDKRLQITGAEYFAENGKNYIRVNAVYYDEAYNFTEDKTYVFTKYALDRIIEDNKGGYTLFPEEGPQICPYREGDSTRISNATPGASVTNKYALYYGQVEGSIMLCTFKAVGEDPAKGWLYEYTNTGRIDDYWLDGYEPESIEGSASYSITDTWGFCIDGRYYAMMDNAASGGEKLVDITDQVTGLALPEDLSTLFDGTASLYKDYRVMNFIGWSLYHVYDWDQYFIVEKPVRLKVTGDTALAFYGVESEESYYYYPGVYRFEKGKAEPTTAEIDVPEVFEPSYSYHPVTEKIGYLMVFGIWENENGTEYLAQVLKTTDGGLTWTLVREGGYITGGTSHDNVYYSTFLTEDFGVVAFNCNFDIDLARHVYYTTDGGKTWRHMTGLNNLPRDPDEEWDLQKITLENGVYTITINPLGCDQYIYFTSTDLENWEPVPQVVCNSVSETGTADFYDTKAYEKYGMYNAYFEIFVTAPMKNVCLVELDESVYLRPGETLYTAGDLTPGTTVVIHTYLGDIHYNRGISYTDENGVTRYLALSLGDYGGIGVSGITFD